MKNIKSSSSGCKSPETVEEIVYSWSEEGREVSKEKTVMQLICTIMYIPVNIFLTKINEHITWHLLENIQTLISCSY